jgi:hypothetical protein
VPQAGSLDASDPHDEYGSPGDVWLFEAKPDMIYRVTLDSARFDALLAVDAGGAVRRAPIIIDDKGGEDAARTNSIARFSTSAPTTVRIRAGTVQRDGGAYTIKIVAERSCASVQELPFLYGCADVPPPSPAEATRQRDAALAELKALVDAGKPEGFLNAGMVAYSEGRHGDAAAMFERAYAGGIQVAGLNLAGIHADPTEAFPGHNPARAIEIWTALAGQRSTLPAGRRTEALERLASAYERGSVGVQQDSARALDYYGRAALAGSVKAATFLGRLYEYGARAAFPREETSGRMSDYVRRVQAERRATPLNVTPDLAISTRWWGVAARLNDAAAMMEYARRFDAGKGMPRDTPQTLYWLRKAAVARNPEAIETLKSAVADGLFK